MNLIRVNIFFKKYLPMFLLLCFSGNPIFTHMDYSKILLIGYTLIFVVYTLYKVNLKIFKKALGILITLIIFILVLISFQNMSLGFVSYSSVFGNIIKLILCVCTLVYYQSEKFDILDTYITILTFLAVTSIPFFILNQFVFYGIPYGSNVTKSLLIFTSFYLPNDPITRNSGMFWEPGAFAGYLVLAIIFIVLKNGKFQIGTYKKEVILILLGLLTTFSTTGYISLGVIIVIFSFQNFKWGRIIVGPVIILIIIYAYVSLDFMKQKIESQIEYTVNMKQDEVNPGRFAAFKMDLEYIKSQPLTGNGVDVSTRWRFHPKVKGDFGHGNGMSNFIAVWGIPLFLFWTYCVYSFIKKNSRSTVTTIIAVLIIVILLQGEQFLNYPMFNLFFFLPFIYHNVMSPEKKLLVIKKYLILKRIL